MASQISRRHFVEKSLLAMGAVLLCPGTAHADETDEVGLSPLANLTMGEYLRTYMPEQYAMLDPTVQDKMDNTPMQDVPSEALVKPLDERQRLNAFAISISGNKSRTYDNAYLLYGDGVTIPNISCPVMTCGASMYNETTGNMEFVNSSSDYNVGSMSFFFQTRSNLPTGCYYSIVYTMTVTPPAGYVCEAPAQAFFRVFIPVNG